MSPSLIISVNKLYGVHNIQKKRIGTYPFRRMSARARFLRGVPRHWIPTRHTVLWSLVLVKVRVCNVISTRTWCLQNRKQRKIFEFVHLLSLELRDWLIILVKIGMMTFTCVANVAQRYNVAQTFITMIRDT